LEMVNFLPAVNPEPHPEWSICIANYNGEAMLRECIDSILGQVPRASFQIIVHDDASTDHSLALLRTAYPQVDVLVSLTNVGFCIANNRMAAISRAPRLLLLNNDAALFRDAIATLSSAAAASSEGIMTLPQYDWKTGKLVDRGCLLDPFNNPIPNLDAQCQSVGMVIGACLAIPKQTWDNLGGFPIWLESIGEDLFLCAMARLAAIPVSVAATSGYRHRQGVSFGGNRAGTSGLSTTLRRRRLSERNKTSVLVVTTPTWVVWPLTLVHLALLAVEGLLLTVMKRDAVIWREIYWYTLKFVLTNSRFLLLQRKNAQLRRRAGLRSFLRPMRLSLHKLSLLRTHGVPSIAQPIRDPTREHPKK
jgi:GT2 family glycosyltransferase